MRRNCVSEIFRTVDAAGAEPGGRIDTRWSLDFIPFVAAGAVNATWNVVRRDTLLSYRRWRLDDMYRHESPLHVRLRESNILTSTIYHRNADDSFFLLFTDDLVAVRPIFGAVNVASGLGAAAVGVPLLPFDRGETLMSGVRGALFSLPELAFVNLRKGSFDYVPREQRPETGAEVAAESDPGPAGLGSASPRPASAIRGQEERNRPAAGPRMLLHLARVQRDDARGERPLEFGRAVPRRSCTRLGARPERDLDSMPSTALGTGDREVQPAATRIETP